MLSKAVICSRRAEAVPPAQEFMVWSRNHPGAAKELMAHPHGLQRAGHYLYKEYWNLETK
jgi:hypothetical protein